jgi:hypothetical protein
MSKKRIGKAADKRWGEAWELAHEPGEIQDRIRMDRAKSTRKAQEKNAALIVAEQQKSLALHEARAAAIIEAHPQGMEADVRSRYVKELEGAKRSRDEIELFAQRADAAKRRNAFDIRVSEPDMYGPHSDHRSSYWRDIALVQNADTIPTTPSLNAARERLHRYATVDVPAMPQKYVRQALLDADPARGATVTGEQRTALSTAVGFSGELVVPQWLTELTPIYRPTLCSVRTQISQHPLAPYGMVVQIPNLTGASGVGVQVQLQGVTETNPTTGFLANGSAPFFTANVSPLSGKITVSAQAFERGGDDAVTFDELIFRQLKADLEEVQNTQAIAAILLSLAGTVTDSSSLTTTLFWGDLATAKQDISTASGVRAVASHIFASSDVVNWLQQQVDSEGRPIFTPDLPEVAAAHGTPELDANTGFVLQGCGLYVDDDIPTASTYPQVIVSRAADVLGFEGVPIPAVFSQTEAGHLSYVVTLRSYCAYVPLYSSSAVLTGSAYNVSAS